MPLTTKEAVKLRIDPQGSLGTDYDTLLDALIAEASDKAQTYCDRQFEAATHTHYLDGTGRAWLYLPQGPIISVASVEQIEYSEGVAGAREETPTAIEPWEYLEENRAVEGSIAVGRLIRRNGYWDCGCRNYKIVYDAGFATIPEHLAGAVTRYVIALFRRRATHGLISANEGGADIVAVPDANLEAAYEADLEKFQRSA